MSYGNEQVTGLNGILLDGGGVTYGTGYTGYGGNVAAPVTLTLSGLSAGDEYDIIVYVNGGPNFVAYGSLALTGGANYYFQTAQGGGNLLTSLANGSTTTNVWGGDAPLTPFISSQVSNYIAFNGVTGATHTFTQTNLGAFAFGGWTPIGTSNSWTNIGISGVQVIDEGAATPGPSTWAMMVGGLGMLLAGQRIRRRQFQG